MKYRGQTVYVGLRDVQVDIAQLQVCNIVPFHKNNENDYVQIQGTSHFDNTGVIPSNPLITTFKTFQEYLKHNLRDEQWVLTHLTVVGDIDDIVHALGCGSLRAVSDGSCDFNEGIGTSG